MGTQVKSIQVWAYSLRTPLYTGTKYIENFFDSELIEFFLKRLVKLDNASRRMIDDGNQKYIELDILYDNSDDYIEGVFHTATFGTEQEIVDILSGKKVGNKKSGEGIITDVFFQINKRNGLFLIEKDKSHVFSKQIFLKYFNEKKFLLEDFLIEFNKLNSKFKHENTRTLMMDIIKPKDFIEEVKAFARVKEVYVEYPLLENNNNLISQLEEMSKNKGLKDVDTIKISYRTTVRGGSVRSVDKFFDKILEDDKLNIGISGTLPSNRNKTIQKLASRLTQTFDINVSVNSNGLESFEDLSEEMTRINRFEDLVPEINSGNAVKIELEKVGDISYEETEKRA